MGVPLNGPAQIWSALLNGALDLPVGQTFEGSSHSQLKGRSIQSYVELSTPNLRCSVVERLDLFVMIQDTASNRNLRCEFERWVLSFEFGALLAISDVVKTIKLSGRERAVLRAIDFATGTMGEEVELITHIPPEDLVDTLNGLMEVGYLECVPYAERTSEETFRTTQFDVNPGYGMSLKEALHKLY